jgi:hypothetical protein
MFCPRSGYLAYCLTNFHKFLSSLPNLFHNTSNMTWTAPSINYKYTLMHVHISHQPYGYSPFTLCSWQQVHKPIMYFVTLLLPLCGMMASTWGENNYMCFLQTRSTPLADKLTFCSPKMAFAPQSMLSLSTQHEEIYFPNLVPPKDSLLPMRLKSKNGAITTNTLSFNFSP